MLSLSVSGLEDRYEEQFPGWQLKDFLSEKSFLQLHHLFLSLLKANFPIHIAAWSILVFTETFYSISLTWVKYRLIRLRVKNCRHTGKQ